MEPTEAFPRDDPLASTAQIVQFDSGGETQDEIAQREHWQKTFALARTDLDQAKQRLNEAQLAYQNMRHRRRVRGDEKQQIIDELEAAEAALPRAQTAVDAATIAARRAGVPPGWIRANRDAALPAAQY